MDELNVALVPAHKLVEPVEMVTSGVPDGLTAIVILLERAVAGSAQTMLLVISQVITSPAFKFETA